MKFCTRVRLKPSNDLGEFELDRARSKNNIAENSVALGHETHYTLLFLKPAFSYMYDFLLELSRRDDSDKGHTVWFGC